MFFRKLNDNMIQHVASFLSKEDTLNFSLSCKEAKKDLKKKIFVIQGEAWAEIEVKQDEIAKARSQSPICPLRRSKRRRLG